MKKYYIFSFIVFLICVFFVFLFTFDKKEASGIFRFSSNKPHNKKQAVVISYPSRKKISKKENYVVIVLDDAGLKADYRVLSYKRHLNISVLPEELHTKEWVKKLNNQSVHEMLLHLPMASFKYKNSGLYPGMKREDIAGVLTRWIDAVRGAKGANNHQGSYATSDLKFMRMFFYEFKNKGIYFIDSLTSKKSIAYKLAKSYKIKTLKRNFFLDNIDNIHYIKKRIYEAVLYSSRYGYAVAIGHTTSNYLFAALKESECLIKKYNIKFIKASTLIEVRAQNRRR
jgi:polysaccharide deacetylase 2 family uncharacterized protein YibQ